MSIPVMEAHSGAFRSILVRSGPFLLLNAPLGKRTMCFACCQAHRGLHVGFHLLGIQFYVLLSPYLCFISFLYLDLYVLGEEAWMSLWSFTQTKHVCVLIHI